ncbi:MAG: CAP domain-containing protein [Sedimentibacter sp.]
MKRNKLTALILIMLFALSPVAFAFGTVAASNPSYEERVVQLVNIERQKAGLDALYIDSKISDVARVKSKDMADLNYFDHYSPTYGMANNMLLRFGITYSFWGENIASGQDTPEIVVYEWMNSPTHRANILSQNFTFIGVGYYLDTDGTPFWTQLFTSDEK